MRYVAGTTKTGTSSAEPDFILAGYQGTAGISLFHGTSDTTDGVISVGSGTPTMKCKTLDIGTWDMDADASKNVAHGLTFTNIWSVEVMIVDDSGTTVYPLACKVSVYAGGWYLTSTNVVLERHPTGMFDSTDYNSTASSRGWIIIWYNV